MIAAFLMPISIIFPKEIRVYFSVNAIWQFIGIQKVSDFFELFIFYYAAVILNQ